MRFSLNYVFVFHEPENLKICGVIMNITTY